VNWRPYVSGVLSAAAGAIALGPWGVAFGAVGAAFLVPPKWRLFAFLPLALLPANVEPVGLVVLGLITASILMALEWTRETAVAAALVGAFVPLALWLMPRLSTFFAGDAGLAAFFVGGAAVASLGFALALLPARKALE
jgi:hypothetical protein